MVLVSPTQIAVATVMVVLMIMGLTQASAVAVVDRAAVEGDECRASPGLPLQVRLNNGVYVPRIGFGTAGLGEATEESVDMALAAGYRHIDTAQAQEWYREDAVGRAVKRATASSSGGGGEVSSSLALSRGDVFVTTKIHPRDFGSDRIRAVVEASDGNLQGVDLLLLHSPHCWAESCPDNPTPWQDAWRELETLYAEGTVRAIGVSNFSEGLLRELLGLATVVPASVQNWMDPFHQDRAVRALCAANDIAYVAYSTLGGQWAYRPSSSNQPKSNPVSTDATLEKIASSHGTSAQAVALSWALQSGALVLPRSSNPGRVRDNLRMFVDVEGAGAAAAAAAVEEEVSRGEGFKAGGDGAGAGSGASADAGAGASAGTGAGGGRGGSGGGDSGEVEGGCRAEGEGVVPVVEVFLTEEDMTAIDLLDGTIGG